MNLTNLSIPFCPPNETLNLIWTNHGISHCLMDTVTSSVIAGYLLIFGTIQLLIYRKYAIPIEDPAQISRSKLYYFQVFLLILVPMLSAARFVIEGVVLEGAKIYGFMVNYSILCFTLKIDPNFSFYFRSWLCHWLPFRFYIQFYYYTKNDIICCRRYPRRVMA